MIDWTPELEDSICQRLIAGEALRSIAGKDGIPAESTIYLHILQSTEFSEKYARAREAQMEAMAADILEIADETGNDTKYVGENDTPAPDNEWISRSKLRVDTRKWLMSKLAPKRFGDKIGLVGGDGVGPIQAEITVNFVKPVDAGDDRVS